MASLTDAGEQMSAESPHCIGCFQGYSVGIGSGHVQCHLQWLDSKHDKYGQEHV